MSSAPKPARREISTSHSAPSTGNFLHGALTIVVGILTFAAFICAIMFFSSGGHSADSLSAQTVSAGALQDKVKLESQTANTVHTGSSANGSLSGAGGKASGSGGAGAYATGGSGVAGSSKVASNGDLSTKSGGNAADNSGTGSSNGNNTSVDHGASTGSNGDAGAEGSSAQTADPGNTGNGSSDGSASTNDESGSSSSAPLHRIQSACFGGLGHCYNTGN
jgi:hypothetical protein